MHLTPGQRNNYSVNMVKQDALFSPFFWFIFVLYTLLLMSSLDNANMVCL